MIYKKLTPRMDFFIDDSLKTITIRQKWYYDFKVVKCVAPWTYSEENQFHAKVAKIIEESWGEFFYLKSKGTNMFGIKNFFTDWDVNFTIERSYYSHTDRHWEVRVVRVPQGDIRWESYVNWTGQYISLTTNDLNPTTIDRPDQEYYQSILKHEFGHAIGNIPIAGFGITFTDIPHTFKGDEYRSENKFHDDKQSVMNLGEEIRDRHLWYILLELGTMIPGVKFDF